MTAIAVYDANVPYPSTLRDVLIRIALEGAVQAKWTDEILEETLPIFLRIAPISIQTGFTAPVH